MVGEETFSRMATAAKITEDDDAAMVVISRVATTATARAKIAATCTPTPSARDPRMRAVQIISYRVPVKAATECFDTYLFSEISTSSRERRKVKRVSPSTKYE
jgi:hypothetical protein